MSRMTKLRLSAFLVILVGGFASVTVRADPECPFYECASCSDGRDWYGPCWTMDQACDNYGCSYYGSCDEGGMSADLCGCSPCG